MTRQDSASSHSAISGRRPRSGAGANGSSVTRNAASEDGGGCAYLWDADVRLDRCLISENVGSGFFCGGASGPRLIRCTIERNSGGGVSCEGSFPYLTECILRGNRTLTVGGGLLCRNAASPILEACMLTGNMAETGGGACIVDPPPAPEGGPFLFNATIAGNWAVTGAGVLVLLVLSPLLPGSAENPLAVEVSRPPLTGSRSARRRSRGSRRRSSARSALSNARRAG